MDGCGTVCMSVFACVRVHVCVSVSVVVVDVELWQLAFVVSFVMTC